MRLRTRFMNLVVRAACFAIATRWGTVVVVLRFNRCNGTTFRLRLLAMRYIPAHAAGTYPTIATLGTRRALFPTLRKPQNDKG
jgi:hypothetical protein